MSEREITQDPISTDALHGSNGQPGVESFGGTVPTVETTGDTLLGHVQGNPNQKIYQLSDGTKVVRHEPQVGVQYTPPNQFSNHQESMVASPEKDVTPAVTYAPTASELSIKLTHDERGVTAHAVIDNKFAGFLGLLQTVFDNTSKPNTPALPYRLAGSAMPNLQSSQQRVGQPATQPPEQPTKLAEGVNMQDVTDDIITAGSEVIDHANDKKTPAGDPSNIALRGLKRTAKFALRPSLAKAVLATTIITSGGAYYWASDGENLFNINPVVAATNVQAGFMQAVRHPIATIASQTQRIKF